MALSKTTLDVGAPAPTVNPSLTAWSTSLKDLPDIGDKAVTKWTSAAKIQQSNKVKRYSNFAEGYIHQIQG